MIVKKIERIGSEGSGDRARNVAMLVDYMRMPEKDSSFAEALLRYLEEEGTPVRGIERLHHLGAVNFLSEHIEGQRAEMMANANAAAKSPNPLDHWLLSWKEHEHPTPGQIDEAASIFLAHLGLAKHQAIYAAHADTHNMHVHIAVNRYDPVRDRMLQVNRGRDWLPGHQATALIVDAQGWEPEDGARYRVENGKLIARRGAGPDVDEAPTISANARSFEVRTGLKSAQRIAIEEANPIMLRARSWHELHYGLSRVGIEILPWGEGAVLRIGQTHVKASSAHRHCSFDKLQERLGPFKSRLSNLRAEKREEERDVMPEAIGALDFKRAQDATRLARTEAIRAVKEMRDDAIGCAHEQARNERQALNKLNDGGRSPERSVLMSVIKEKQKSAEAKAKAAAKESIKRINEKYRLSADYERWLREQNADYLADRWRNRNKLAKWLATFDGKSDHFYHLQELDGFRARELGGVRLWARADERVAFVEHKGRIEVAMRKDEEAITAAFTIAVSKFARVTVNGSDEFKKQAAATIGAADYGNAVINPELRELLANAKSRERGDRGQANEPSAALDDAARPEHDPTSVSTDAEMPRLRRESGLGL